MARISIYKLNHFPNYLELVCSQELGILLLPDLNIISDKPVLIKTQSGISTIKVFSDFEKFKNSLSQKINTLISELKDIKII
jgi:hypothetical protein